MNVLTLSNELAIISSGFFLTQEFCEMKALTDSIKEHTECVLDKV